MVKKLFKHEMIAYLRTLLPVYIVLVGVAALTRFCYIFETDTRIFNIIGTSSVIALVIVCLVCIFLTYVNIITRFYRNLFTNEGYLSFTLPVTTVQHISVKLLTSVGSVIASLLMVVIAVCVATAGEMTVELFKVVGYVFDKVPPLFDGHFWFYFIEIIVAMLLALTDSILLFYSCIAIGQLTRKNRVMAAVGVYFVYYFITQVIGTVFITVFTVVSNTNWFADLVLFMEENPYKFIHIVFGIGIAVSLLLGCLYFFITNTIIKKKLNLE